VLPLMEQDWPSYYGPNEEFWAHEWEKHGTCAEDVFPTQLAYFNTTLALHVANPIEVRAARMLPVSGNDRLTVLEGVASQCLWTGRNVVECRRMTPRPRCPSC